MDGMAKRRSMVSIKLKALLACDMNTIIRQKIREGQLTFAVGSLMVMHIIVNMAKKGASKISVWRDGGRLREFKSIGALRTGGESCTIDITCGLKMM
jgi:hypothetical protein